MDINVIWPIALRMLQDVFTEEPAICPVFSQDHKKDIPG